MTAKHKFIVLGAHDFRNTTTASSKSPQKQTAEHVAWTQEEQMSGTRKKPWSPLRRLKWRDFFFLLYRDVLLPFFVQMSTGSRHQVFTQTIPRVTVCWTEPYGTLTMYPSKRNNTGSLNTRHCIIIPAKLTEIFARLRACFHQTFPLTPLGRNH